MNIIEKYISNAKLALIIEKLYTLHVFHSLLDVALSLIIDNKILFKITEKRFSESQEGCCSTSTSTLYNKFLKKTVYRKTHAIVIKKLEPNVVVHELAHAIEKESGLNISGDFKLAIENDLKHLNGNIVLCNMIKKLMIDEVKQYNAQSQLSELFARYFEIFASSKEICAKGMFTHQEIEQKLYRTTRWMHNTLTPVLQAKILPEVMKIHQNDSIENDHGWQNKEKKLSKKKWSQRHHSLFK